jgi:hypothetical protein
VVKNAAVGLEHEQEVILGEGRREVVDDEV